MIPRTITHDGKPIQGTGLQRPVILSVPSGKVWRVVNTTVLAEKMPSAPLPEGGEFTVHLMAGNAVAMTFDADGYPVLRKVTTGVPPVADCDTSTEHGRMALDAVAGRLYVCAGSWRSVPLGE